MKRAIAILLLAIQLAGCYTWRPQAIAPDAAAPPTTLGAVRVRDRTGRTVELFGATVRGDSLQGKIPRRGHLVDTTIDRHDVVALTVRRLDGGRTALAIVGITTGALLVGVLAALIEYGNSGCCCFCLQ